MKKRIFLSAILSTLMISSLSASTEVEMLKGEIENLKLELSLIKDRVESNEVINNEVVNTLDDTNNNLVDIDERIDDVESIALSNKIRMGFAFRQELDNFQNKYSDGRTSDSGFIGLTRLRLNLISEVTDNMKFYGRLSMTKFWGNESAHYNLPYTDQTQGRIPSDSALYVERAFMSIDMFKDTKVPLTLELGRLPTSDGPSVQFKENTLIKSTYSALVFDGAADGAILTLNTEQLLKLPKSNFKIAYAKFVQNNDLYNPDNDSLKDSNVLGIFFNTNLFKDSDSNLKFGLVRGFDVMNERGETAGDINFAYASIEFPDVYKTGLSLFTHIAMSQTNPSNSNLTGGKLLNSNEDKTGTAFWIGGRYKIKNSSLNNPRIGFEYNYGSKNWINMSSGTSDIGNKFAIRGNAYEAYYTQPINPHSFLRLSATYYDITNSGNAMQIFAPTGDNGEFGTELSSAQRVNLTFNVKF